MASQSALVLGVSGMIGLPLAESLVAEGWQVHGAARFGDDAARQEVKALGVQDIRFDVTSDDPAVLPDVDVVFLEVWDPRREDLIWPINFYGVGRVVQRYAGKADIVNGCTINVYGDSADQPDEETPCRPTSVYGLSRAAQEKLIDYFVWQGGTKGIHVRYAHSNTSKQGMIRRLAEAILKSESLGPDPDARVQVISIEDFVRVTIASVEKMATPPTAVNCCHPQVWTRRQLAEAIHQGLGRGKVIFDRPEGGSEHSAYAKVDRMIDWFGSPTIAPELLIERVVSEISQRG
jgi:nucleoside-diphosphate-sugar epimerase